MVSMQIEEAREMVRVASNFLAAQEPAAMKDMRLEQIERRSDNEFSIVLSFPDGGFTFGPLAARVYKDVLHLEVVEEQPLSSYGIARRPEFRYLGLTDTALSALAQDFLVVSKDFRMVNHLSAIGEYALKWVEVQGV